MHGIGLFLGTERGYHVLSELLKTNKKLAFLLILVQEKHEYADFTDQIIALCKENKIFYSTTKDIKSNNYLEFLTAHPCSSLFVISWRFLIPQSCFSIPKRGIFILHDSLLPKYRGYSPTNW